MKEVVEPGDETILWQEGEGTYRDKYARAYPRVVLMHNDTIWMMDTPFEQQTAAPAVREAKGKCLVVGLGIGMVPSFFARRPDVESVTVVELSPEVVELVGGQLKDSELKKNHPWLEKIKIINQDFWDYAKTTEDRFDTVQIDIWPTALTAIQNCDEATQLATRLLLPGGHVYCWMAEHKKLIEESNDFRAIAALTSGIH